MFQISKEFAPPFGLIVPFFIAGTIFYLLSMAALLFYSPHFHHAQLQIAGWIHLFLVGYVMMIIFGAMAQLVPVVLETGHFSVEWYYVIFWMLLAGVSLLIVGFWSAPLMLAFGGLLVLAAMVTFAVEVFLTIRRSELESLTAHAVKLSNAFLLTGIVTGFLMALAFGGFLGIEIERLFLAHVYSVVAGYILVTIYGITLVLLPMFGLAHGFAEWPAKWALRVVSASVVLIFLGSLFDVAILRAVGYLGVFGSVVLHFYQVWLIYRVRVRRELDIWYASMLYAYGALALALLLGLLYLLGGATYDPLLHGAFWFLLLFFAFLINGHLYKIIPFLVWFHRYSHLVGKAKVPMLHEMYPKKAAWFEYGFSAIGGLLAGAGLLFGSDALFRGGASFLLVGAIFLALSVKWMLGFRSEHG